MRQRFTTSIFVLAGLVLLPAMLFSQQRGAGFGGRGRGAAPPPPTNQPFDPKDLSGIWWRTGGTREWNTQKGEEPVFTAEGKKAFDANKPGYGPRAVPPAQGNDPLGDCNPDGLPRNLMFNRPVEFIQLPNRLIQLYQYHGARREVWLDGRKLPENPDLPRWYGYSVGRWEGNTLIVETSGLEPRQWLDNLGNPYSDQARMTERYTRVDHDHIEMVATLTDPKFYAKPFVSQKKTWELLTKPEQYSVQPDWNSLMEELCAPIDEVFEFNKRIRNKAGGIE
jgi:hypothetical protein